MLRRFIKRKKLRPTILLLGVCFAFITLLLVSPAVDGVEAWTNAQGLLNEVTHPTMPMQGVGGMPTIQEAQRYVDDAFQSMLWRCAEAVLAAFATATCWFMWYPARPPPPSLCPQCGYDIRASGERCSECGLPLGKSDEIEQLSSARKVDSYIGIVATVVAVLLLFPSITNLMVLFADVKYAVEMSERTPRNGVTPPDSGAGWMVTKSVVPALWTVVPCLLMGIVAGRSWYVSSGRRRQLNRT